MRPEHTLGLSRARFTPFPGLFYNRPEAHPLAPEASFRPMPIDHVNALPPGTRFEEYRLDAVLGAGGFRHHLPGL